MTFPLFCNKSGNARSLKRLAQEHLGKEIQRKGLNGRGVLHDPLEDATAVMELYTKVIAASPPAAYDDMVAYYTNQIMERMQSCTQQESDESDE
eukprot:jgi/Chrzof1/10532/Cz05g02080.t1